MRGVPHHTAIRGVARRNSRSDGTPPAAPKTGNRDVGRPEEQVFKRINKNFDNFGISPGTSTAPAQDRNTANEVTVCLFEFSK